MVWRASPGGLPPGLGVVQEGFDLRERGGLVAFEGQDVVGVGFDDFLGDGLLVVEGIGGDDAAGQFELAQQGAHGGDLVALLGGPGVGRG